MKIAIVGSGISGLTAACLLAGEHDITLFEAGERLGGHTDTVRLQHAGRAVTLDTGFMVFNDRTYPNFTALLNRLGVESQPSEMSFSVACEQTGLEYSGTSLNTLFAQRRNLLRPQFYGLLRDIVRFNRTAPELLKHLNDGPSLGEYLHHQRFGAAFVERYLLPMGAAIWSAAPGQIREFPARRFVQFFHNHGLLSLSDRPQWKVIRGGADHYIAAMTRSFADRIRLNAPIAAIRRHAEYVALRTAGGPEELFDHAIVAAHSDQALRMLADPTAAERDVLSSLTYQPNEAVLHTDVSLLPQRRLAWASWNYRVLPDAGRPATVTYWLNRLQSVPGPEQFLVTLNPHVEIDPARVLRRMTYHHPQVTASSVAAQSRYTEISGVRRTYYCGAYWGYGFHEDGVNSALAVAAQFGVSLSTCKAASTKDESGIAALAR